MSAICDLTNQVNQGFAQINQNFAALFAGQGSGGITPKVKIGTWTGIWWYGQSLAVGADGVPVAHTTPVNGHLTFDNGPNYPVGAELSVIDQLFEVGVETPCSAMASGITQRRLLEGDSDLIVFTATGGVGGVGIASLVPGTPYYTQFAAYHGAAQALATAQDKSYVSSAVCWLQGETDAAGAMTKASYLSQLTAISNTVKATMDAAFLTYQTNAYITVSSGPALAQLEADETNNIYFVTPIYFLSLSAGAPNIHPSANSYQEIGFRFARAWSDLLYLGKIRRIRLVNVIQEGDVRVVAVFECPTAPLTTDTTRVPATTNYGFRLVDTIGTVPLSSTVVSGSTVVFTASRVIVGALTLRYGLDYNTTPYINGAGGNIVDSTLDTVWIGGSLRSLRHWCPAFEATAIKLVDPNYPALTTGPELDAWEHWTLDTNSASLTGDVHSRVLTPVDTVNYNSTAVVCPAGLAGFVNGLKTSLDDQLSYTFMAVIKRPVDASGDYCFILGNVDVVAATGAGLLTFSTPSTQLTVNAPGVAVSFGRLWSDTTIDPGDWCFVVYRSNAGKSAGMIGGATLLEDATVRAVAANKIGIGNCYVPISNCDNELQVAEAILYDSSLTEGQINGIYIRSQARMLLKGITI